MIIFRKNTNRRYIAFTFAISIHFVVFSLVVLNRQQFTKVIYRRESTKIFGVRSIPNQILHEPTSSIAVVGHNRMPSDSAPLSKKFLEKSKTVNEDINGRREIDNFTAKIDPFFNPSLNDPTIVSAITVPNTTLFSVDTIDHLIKIMDLNGIILPCWTVTASFSVTKQGDGSVSDIRFIEGSAGPELGERLAQIIKERVALSPSTDGSTSRIIIGPIVFNFSETRDKGSASLGRDQCRG